MVSSFNRKWSTAAAAGAAACLCLLRGGTTFAFSSREKTTRFQPSKVKSRLRSSQGPYNFMGDERNGVDGPMSNGQERQFRMVKQFNGDFKAVPYSEVDPPRNPASFAEMENLASRYRGQNPNLTSPARSIMGKQWDWENPSPEHPRPKFRQVRTFSGDVKTVPYEENAFRGPSNSEFGRVDGTNYIPDLAPRIVYRDDPVRIPPPPPPPGPPPQRRPQNPWRPSYERRRQQQPEYGYPPPRENMYPARRQDMERFKTKLVGSEMRREMRKYKQDDGFPNEEDELFFLEREQRRESKDPLKKLAKETEKLLRQLTGLGGGDKKPAMLPPQRREPYRGSRRNPAEEEEFRRREAEDFRRMEAARLRQMDSNDQRSIAGSFNSSPAIRSFEAQYPTRPPGYYPEGPESRGRPSFAASRAAQSFSTQNRERYQRQSQPRPPYRTERQFNRDDRSSPMYGDDEDDYYGNPAANSEVRRIR